MARIDTFLRHIKDHRGSDLHLIAGIEPRMRSRGLLSVVDGSRSIPDAELRGVLREIVSEEQWKSYESDLELDFAYSISGVGRFRANYFNQASGVAAVFRLIPEEIASLKDLNMPAAVERFAHLRSGLVLVTGPTGSGKSTTLASMIDILVGEMRGQEVELAVSAAEMGALVFGTLHTNSATKTIDRLIDIFPTDKQEQIRISLAEALAGVVSQLLIPTADGTGRVAAVELLAKTSGLPNIKAASSTACRRWTRRSRPWSATARSAPRTPTSARSTNRDSSSCSTHPWTRSSAASRRRFFRAPRRRIAAPLAGAHIRLRKSVGLDTDRLRWLVRPAQSWYMVSLAGSEGCSP